MILVLDEGTSSTRALLFEDDGSIAYCAQAPIEARYPRPGWVEQDAGAIWRESRAVMEQAIDRAGGAARITAIGIANQRETVVAWDRRTGEPLAPAIVWQDRRTASTCAALRERGEEAAVQEATGLVLDPYFSAAKMAWLIEQEPAVADAARTGRLAFGTVESWLLFKLTGAHVTDASNASRTSLMRLDTMAWDEGLCDLFGVPRAALPRIVPMTGDLGTTELFGGPIAISGSAGDQQAATIGQACLAPGAAKATFGTGLFALASTGERRPRSDHRLLATLLYAGEGPPLYALEGSVFVAGSLVKWLRDMAGLVDSAEETEALARSVEDSGGVTIVPAFTGLGAPHWRPELEGSIHGLTFGVTRAHLVRAALEAVTMSTRDLATAFAADGAAWKELRVDGGMIANDWLAQDLADMTEVIVERPTDVESTARGAAMLAGVGAGMFEDLGCAMQGMRTSYERFSPTIRADIRDERIERWGSILSAIV
ncbi:glycerol kinase GlpK [Sphingomicrobium sp. XHP0239]|uniref:FGGY family carbohydrate kinase n=1 Tax=Sphingomicrobium maritimum TaxID=3133972 RepID=UPI0031CC3D31